ncbi:transketolase [Candidatus Woesebacteria bacterium]|nr:transketolase [Candidatus Woesebacteria bacterium]
MTAQDLHEIANRLRGDVLEMVVAAGAGHVAGPLSSADLFAVLYFGEVANLAKDKVVLSCGHYCPIIYSALARSGKLPVEELKTFMQAESRLPGHPERGVTPGVEASTGPLGQGVSVACGMAEGLKLKHGHNYDYKSPRVYCVLSDGELQEGQVWEAFNFAVNRKLDNLIFILDRNRVQIEHFVKEIVSSDEVARLEACGLHVLQCEGNNIAGLTKCLENAKQVQGLPVMVVMDTTGGKGVSFMENKPEWHDKVPTKDELKLALTELEVGDD